MPKAVLKRPAAKAPLRTAKRRLGAKAEQTTSSSDIDNANTSSSDKEKSQAGFLPIEVLNKRDDRRSSRKVLVLYTGGTVGMAQLPDGSLAPVPGSLAARLRRMEELQQERMPECSLIEFNPLLDSADMSPEDWTKMASTIGDNYYEYDGFVVLHGTDTLAYTSSALSFMLEQLAKPVVVTGAQLPLSEPVSDARQNFLGSILFAGLADISEVCVYFAGKLLRGCRAMKQSASGMAAFTSPNFPPIARQGTEIEIFTRRLREPPRGRFRVHSFGEEPPHIMAVWVIPGFSDEVLKPLLHSKNIKGIVLMLYGCGNAPARKACFVEVLRKLVNHGVVVVACSQCIQGTVVLDKYKTGRAFEDAGVVSAMDMTVEAAISKMSYLFSKGLSPEQCRRSMGEDLRGELTSSVSTLKIGEPVTGIDPMF